jgi:hypothetical protein
MTWLVRFWQRITKRWRKQEKEKIGERVRILPDPPG